MRSIHVGPGIIYWFRNQMLCISTSEPLLHKALAGQNFHFLVLFTHQNVEKMAKTVVSIGHFEGLFGSFHHTGVYFYQGKDL